MADLILLTFFVMTFAVGAWCGKTFGSVTDMAQRIKKALKE